LPNLWLARGLAVEAVQGLLDDLPNLPRITKVCAAMNEDDGGWEQFWSVPHKFIGQHMGKYKVEYPENGRIDGYEVDVMWYAKSLGCLGKPHPGLYDMLCQCGRLDLLKSRWVPVLSWGRLCEKYNVSSVDVVQLDCEGMDAAIVRGLAKHCERHAAAWPRVIQFEANHLTPNEEVIGTVVQHIARAFLTTRRCHGNRDGDIAAPAVLHSLLWLQKATMPVLHSSAPQQHLRLLRHRLMCAVLHSLCIACVSARDI
jgi:hypothetical protein